MKVTRLVAVEVEARYVRVDVPVPPGEDALPFDFPGRVPGAGGGPDRWVADVDVDALRLVNWPAGREDGVDLEVGSGGTYTLFGDGLAVLAGPAAGYVPDCLGGGTSVRFDVAADGRIAGLERHMRPDAVAEDFFAI